ncbi:MAG: O-methyltransferase [Lachnospiraceae bacterium]|nr:O-methyltransferase [Lachnospiraceae bacterium]MEE1341098.1 O-methyltransferase [Lachnospiraceae bacterium]
MIVSEQITAYINTLNTLEAREVEELRKEATKNLVPIIKPETKELLKVLVTIKKPMRILEVGTAVGYSAIVMHTYQPEGGQLTTIEKFPSRIKEAKENFKKHHMEEEISLLEGDAIEILKTLEGSFDMIFMDAAKGQYIHFLQDVLRLLAKDGLLISDNVLQDGDVAKSKYSIIRRNRTIHKRMRDYLYTLKHHEQLLTSIVPIGDGVAISVKQS